MPLNCRDPRWRQAVTLALAEFGVLAGLRREFQLLSETKFVWQCRCRFLEPRALLLLNSRAGSGEFTIPLPTLQDGREVVVQHRAYVELKQLVRTQLATLRCFVRAACVSDSEKSAERNRRCHRHLSVAGSISYRRAPPSISVSPTLCALRARSHSQPRNALREIGSIEEQACEIRIGLCDSLGGCTTTSTTSSSSSSSPLLVLWRHASARGEGVFAEVHPRKKVLSLLVGVGRGRECRATEERSELRMDFKLTNLLGQMHLRRAGGRYRIACRSRSRCRHTNEAGVCAHFH